jgi:hypothetical protein
LKEALANLKALKEHSAEERQKHDAEIIKMVKKSQKQ